MNISKIIILVGITLISLISCITRKYTKKELIQLKEENKIKTNNQEIKNNLEWISYQEKPFNIIDNKWYFVIWRDTKNNNWKITKFKNNIDLKTPSAKKKIDSLNGYELKLINSGIKGINLNIYKSGFFAFSYWWNNNNYNYFKTIYRWNLLNKLAPNLYIDNNNNINIK